MFAATHASAGVKSVPDAATDEILDGAYGGWDARVYIAEPGEDPFEGIDDLDLLHAHAGVIAATVMAQANQMRVLDSAIVPDRDLVRPTLNPTGKFNEFKVYTPLTPPERYAVITESGAEEVVTPSTPFYPGLAERVDAGQTAIQLALEDATEDPYMIGLATGTALLQVGIEAGFDVGLVAEVLNRAWGVDAMFSPGTVVGLAGASNYAALFAQDRNTNARRLASWQACSYVRSGQLAMETVDWGAQLHCDFRRVRVAAESLFATSVAVEATAANPLPAGAIVYHVPSTSLLSANPAYLFFSDASPDRMPTQPQCPAAAAILAKAKEHGVLKAIWPSTEPVIAETWAATFGDQGGLAMTPVEFVPRTMTTGPLFAAATARVAHMGKSFASALGRTVMTTLSAKLATIATNVITVQRIAWLARFAAVVEIMRLSTSAAERVAVAAASWQSLAGDVARDLERSMSTAHMAELRRSLPPELRTTMPVRSSKTPIFALLIEVGNPRTAPQHTVLRGLRYAFSRAADVAQAVVIREKVGWRADHAHEWLAARLAVVREFWAVQFAALSQVAHAARPLRSDLRWWVEVSAAVNLFRAGVMRGYAVADEGGAVAAYAGEVGIRCRPYHAAAHLQKTLAPYIPAMLPSFDAGAIISDWAYDLTTVTAPYVTREYANIPRQARANSTSDHTSHFTRGATLLASEGALSDWMASTTALVVADCEALLERRAAVLAITSTPAPNAPSPLVTAAVVAAADAISRAMEELRVAVPPTALYSTIEDDVAEDTWDSFLEAAYDTTDAKHADAAKQLKAAKECRDPAAAAAITRWIIATFAEYPAETAARIV